LEVTLVRCAPDRVGPGRRPSRTRGTVNGSPRRARTTESRPCSWRPGSAPFSRWHGSGQARSEGRVRGFLPFTAGQAAASVAASTLDLAARWHGVFPRAGTTGCKPGGGLAAALRSRRAARWHGVFPRAGTAGCKHGAGLTAALRSLRRCTSACRPGTSRSWTALRRDRGSRGRTQARRAGECREGKSRLTTKLSGREPVVTRAPHVETGRARECGPEPAKPGSRSGSSALFGVFLRFSLGLECVLENVLPLHLLQQLARSAAAKASFPTCWRHACVPVLAGVDRKKLTKNGRNCYLSSVMSVGGRK
jgi:hypothetical protein